MFFRPLKRAGGWCAGSITSVLRLGLPHSAKGRTTGFAGLQSQFDVSVSRTRLVFFHSFRKRANRTIADILRRPYRTPYIILGWVPTLKGGASLRCAYGAG